MVCVQDAKSIQHSLTCGLVMPIIRGVIGALAQLGERNTGSVEVSGSIPLGSTN